MLKTRKIFFITLISILNQTHNTKSSLIINTESDMAAYIQTLVPEIKDDISKIKKTLWYSWDGTLLNLIPSQLLEQAKREPIEVASVYRFKCIAKTDAEDFSKWISQQKNDFIQEVLAHADSHPDKTSLITWQNNTYPEYLNKEQAFERLIQTKHFEVQANKKKG